MGIGLLGKKIGMTQIFSETGKQVAVTVLKVDPNFVIQKKTAEKDGYSAVQLGTQVKRKATKPYAGQFKNANKGLFRCLKEIRSTSIDGLNVGDQISIESFSVGDFVNVTTKSIGKGFQGVVKRHGFSGGPGGHGSMFHRRPGSIGATAGGKGCTKGVARGKKLPGQDGHKQITVHNLQIVDLDAENQLLVIKGSIPGGGSNLVVVQNSFKKTPKNEWKIIQTEKEEENSEAAEATVEAAEEPTSSDKSES